jgi:hypothetical protein
LLKQNETIRSRSRGKTSPKANFKLNKIADDKTMGSYIEHMYGDINITITKDQPNNFGGYGILENLGGEILS